MTDREKSFEWAIYSLSLFSFLFSVLRCWSIPFFFFFSSCSFSFVLFFLFSSRFFFSCPAHLRSVVFCFRFFLWPFLRSSIQARYYAMMACLAPGTKYEYVVYPDATIRINIHAKAESTIMTNEHTSLEKYTSHTLFEMVAKGLRKGYAWEVSWRLNRDCNILTPSSSVVSSTSFSFCWAAQPGDLRALPSAESWFSLPRTATTDSKLTEPVCSPGLYNCLTPTCFLWASHLHLI